nr:unnamed protein product [Callosobruchus analis]
MNRTTVFEVITLPIKYDKAKSLKDLFDEPMLTRTRVTRFVKEQVHYESQGILDNIHGAQKIEQLVKSLTLKNTIYACIRITLFNYKSYIVVEILEYVRIPIANHLAKQAIKTSMNHYKKKTGKMCIQLEINLIDVDYRVLYRFSRNSVKWLAERFLRDKFESRGGVLRATGKK